MSWSGRPMAARGIAICSLLALLMAISACGDSKADLVTGSEAGAGSDRIPGELGSDVDQIIEGLDPEEQACIEATEGPAQAAAACVTREKLADQAWEVIAGSPLLDGAPEEEVRLLKACFIRAIIALEDDEIDDLAALGAAAMAVVADELLACSLDPPTL